MSSHLARGAAERAALTGVFGLGLSRPFCLGPGGRLDMAAPSSVRFAWAAVTAKRATEAAEAARHEAIATSPADSW